MIYQQMNIRVRRGMPTNKSRTMREGGRGHVQRRRQGLWHERRHADAADAELGSSGRSSWRHARFHPFWGGCLVCRSSILRDGCSLNAISGRTSARASRSCKTITCCFAATSTARGTNISTPSRTGFQAVSTFSGIRARDIRTRSPLHPSRIISGRIRSTRIITTMRRQAPRNATSRRHCAFGAPFSSSPSCIRP